MSQQYMDRSDKSSVYRYYQQGNYMGTPPTLQDFREELLKQDELEAQEIALAIELFTNGSLNTFIFIDEIHRLFQHEYSANFLFTLWKRVRKYGAYCTGITQNVDDLLQSHTARTMLANSEFIIMLNQASTDRIELGEV